MGVLIKVKDGEHHFRGTFDQVRVAMHLAEADRAGVTLPSLDEPSSWHGGAPLEARVDANRWIADCPDCPGAEYVYSGAHVFMCLNCFNAAVDGKWRTVVFPRSRAAIESVLESRPNPLDRHWRPGTSVAQLRRELIHHSYTNPATAVTGDLIPAAFWNQYGRDDIRETAPAKVTTKGDILAALGVNSIGRLAIGGDGSALLADSTQLLGVRWGHPVVPETQFVPSRIGPINTEEDVITFSDLQVGHIYEVDGSCRCSNDGSGSTAHFSFQNGAGSIYGVELSATTTCGFVVPTFNFVATSSTLVMHIRNTDGDTRLYVDPFGPLSGSGGMTLVSMMSAREIG